jgi:26S proteasome regulatory subunit N7
MADMDEIEEVEVPPEKTFPDMQLAQKAFGLENSEDVAATKAEVMVAIEADKMAPFYENLCTHHGWMLDEAMAASLKAANATELEALKATLKDAEETQGEMEVLDALFALAKFHSRIASKAEAYAAFDAIIAKAKVSTGKKIDASMGKLRMALFYLDLEAMRKLVPAAKKLVDEGGDWDRRNRLKVYEAVFLMLERDFKSAAALLLDGIATFTCTELCSYDTFVYYAVVTNMLYLERPALKKKLVDGPEVLAAAAHLRPLDAMAAHLYECEYGGFFASLVDLHGALLRDRYLARHARFLVREYRVLSFAQFLGAYKSVKLDTMAQAFGISVPFLDAELSRFIAGGRLNAKIDKVGGKVETNPPDQRNAQYQAVIKKGDLLLTSIQKLARVIDA